MKRETHKDIEISGRNFRIAKFDALTGSYIVFTLLSQLDGFSKTGMNAESLTRDLMGMNKEKFFSLQRDCLNVCSELQSMPNIAQPVPIPIIMADGRWGVDDLQFDLITILLLTVHTLLFNISGFFDAGILETITSSFSGLPLSNMPNLSTVTPTPQS